MGPILHTLGVGRGEVDGEGLILRTVHALGPYRPVFSGCADCYLGQGAGLPMCVLG